MLYARAGCLRSLVETWPWRSVALLLAFALLLPACSSLPPSKLPAGQIPPLQLQGRTLVVADAVTIAPTPDLLEVDPEMRDFAAQYTGGILSDRQRMFMLHRSLIGAGTLDIQYDPFADGSAAEVFHRGAANCLSYASLFVALAREAGLDARYQWVEMRPEWGRLGERVAVRLHVNVVVNLRNGARYIVDLEPLPSRDVADYRPLADRDAQALYHGNIAMDALAAGDIERAWAHGVQSVRLSPDMPHLWVNLGAVYRLAGQFRDAEQSYFVALDLNHSDHSAMNNLVVLYSMEGREEEQRYWKERVSRYRDRNPFYHAWLGDQAGELGHWDEALRHYDEAVKLLPKDSQLLYAKGLIHYRLHDLERAAHFMEKALEHATRPTDIDTYRRQMEAVKRELLAGARAGPDGVNSP